MSGGADGLLNLVALGCPVVRSSPLDRSMDILVYLGHGGVDSAIALAITASGILARDRRLQRAGLVALLAVLVAGLLADLLKVVFQMPRPVAGWGYGFPSGHTSTAFALAGTLGQVFPALAPILSLLAVIAGVARLYERSHFVIDVLGGALLGTATAILIGRKALGATRGGRGGARSRWQWAVPGALGVVALAFFAVYERALAAHQPSASPPPLVVVNFGAPEGRAHLRAGWLEAEHRAETFPRMWSEGPESVIGLPPLPPAGAYRLRVKVRPYVQHGGRALCQMVEVEMNGVPAGRFLLERDWREYELKLAPHLIRPGATEVRFRFAAGGPAREGHAAGSDERTPHAAFATLEILPAPK